MQRRRTLALALSAGVLACGPVWAAPAQADTTADAFLSALTNAGVSTADPTSAAALGQQVQGGEQLLLGQITRGAEQHHDIGSLTSLLGHGCPPLARVRAC